MGPSSSDMKEDEWIVVKKRGKRKSVGNPPAVHGSLSGAHQRMSRRPKLPEVDYMEYSKERHDKLRERVEAHTKAMRESRWWESTKQQLQEAIEGREVVALHCLGVGSFVNSKSSSYQMGCAMLVRHTFAQGAKCTIADPVMGAVDRAFVDEKGFSVIDTGHISEGGGEKDVKIAEAHVVENGKCVLWFMPHCTRTLYDYVLRKCSEFEYEGMVIMGNKLSEYTTEQDKGKSKTLDMLNKEKRFIERDCPSSELSPYPDAFNSLSVLTMKNEKELRDRCL